ncbi:MAG: hypothetical protein WC683_11800 [bacterium]
MKQAFDIRMVIFGVLMFAIIGGLIVMFVAATNNTLPETREIVDVYHNWSDDFSADTSADYTTAGTSTATWEPTNGVLNLTGADGSALITGETFGPGTYSMNVSFKSATNPGGVILFIGR